MVISNSHIESSAGILSPATRRALLAEGEEIASDTEQKHDIREQVQTALADFELLYYTASDDILASVFGEGNEVASHCYGGLRLLCYLLSNATDAPDAHLAQALTQAYAAMDQHATVYIDVTTEPFLPPEKRLQRIANGGVDAVAYEAFEQLLYNDYVEAESVVAALEDTIFEVSVDEIKEMREIAAGCERTPFSAVIDVNVTEEEVDDESK
jgi:hypothetical protein